MKIPILSSVLSAAVLLSSPLLAQHKASLVDKLKESLRAESSGSTKMKALRAYLAKGGDINAVDKRGSSLLTAWLFAELDKETAREMLDFMIKKGININYQRKYPEGCGGDNLGQGGTVLMRACMGNHTTSDVDGGGADPYIVGLLLNAGADVHLKDESGYDALDTALWSAVPELVVMLIDAGADFKRIDEEGRNLLMNHAGGNEPDPNMVPVLVKAGLGINERDKEGKTALAIFCESFPGYQKHYPDEYYENEDYSEEEVDEGMPGDEERLIFLKALLNAGADPKIRDAEGKTAMDRLKVHLPDSHNLIDRLRK